jgi:hypothetical protein
MKADRFIFALSILSGLIYLGLYLNVTTPILLLIVISFIVSLLYVLLCVVLRRHGDRLPDRAYLVIIGIGVLIRLAVMPVAPIASGDVYRYIWDGKVIAHGFNPYRYAPADSVLKPLHSPNLPEKDITTMTTIYPPLAEWIFAASYAIFGESPNGIKIFSFIAECVSLILLVQILKALQKPPALVALYALCPLPVLQFMVDAHFDGLAFPFLLSGILLWLKRKELSSFVVLSLGILIKFLPALFIPLLLREQTKARKISLIAIPAAIAVAAYLPYIIGGGSPFSSLAVYSEQWYFNGVFFDGILALGFSNEISHLIVSVLFIASFAFILFSKKPLLEKLYLTLICFFLFSAVVHPWYVTWIAILLPICFRWSGVAYVTLINIANIVIINWKSYHFWYQSSGHLLLEYLPIIAIFLYELLRPKSSFTT